MRSEKLWKSVIAQKDTELREVTEGNRARLIHLDSSHSSKFWEISMLLPLAGE